MVSRLTPVSLCPAAVTACGRDLLRHRAGEIGPEFFRHACLMGLEGLVSKLDDRPYRPGRSPSWVKVKNPASPAILRAKELAPARRGAGWGHGARPRLD